MPGFKKLPNAKPIVNITIDEDLLSKIENFQFENRIPNRSQAFSKLVLEGFESIENNKVSDEKKKMLIDLINKL